MDEDQRFFPASPEETFDALRVFVRKQYGIRSQDEFSRSVTYQASGLTGPMMSATVVPAEGGCALRVSGAPKIRTAIGSKGQVQRALGEVLDGTSRTIQHARAD